MSLLTSKRRNYAADSSIRASLASLERAHKSVPQESTDSNSAALKAMSGFAAAKRDRFSDDWAPGQSHPVSLQRADGKFMRERARDLVLNNPLAKAAVDAYVANVIECGITPKPRFDDAEGRRMWVSAWDNWCGKYEREADITGQQHYYELLALWLTEVIVGGGCLTHFVDMPRSGGRRIPLAVELIAEERFADDRDTFLRWKANKKTSNPVVNGIEVEQSSGRTLGYWIKPQDLTGYDLDIEPRFIPANECEYAFFKNRIGQYRGYTMMHAAIMWLWKLGYYTDNELMASAVKSCFAAVISTADGAFGALNDGDPNGPSADEYMNTMEKLQPAMVARIRPGESITGVGPNVPGGDSKSWIIFIERSIGIALGLSYEELCRDYSQGNFSSTRASANSDRKRFRRMQEFSISHMCGPTWKRFVMSASRVGIQGFPAPSQLVSSMDEWLEVSWRRPGWASVNPLDDARADDVKLKNGSRTLEEIAAGEGGNDWEERLEQRGREEDKADSLQLRITGSKDDPSIVSNQTASDTKGGNGN